MYIEHGVLLYTAEKCKFWIQKQAHKNSKQVPGASSAWDQTDHLLFLFNLGLRQPEHKQEQGEKKKNN